MGIRADTPHVLSAALIRKLPPPRGELWYLIRHAGARVAPSPTGIGGTARPTHWRGI